FDDVLPTGQKVQYAAAEDIAVRRPSRVYTEYQGDLGAKQFWYDGKSVTMYDTGANVWATTPVPAKIDAALDDLMKKHGFSPPLSDLLYSDPYAILKPHAQFGLYMGTSDVDGTRCHHLAFVDKEIDWQLWVEDGTEVVPCKMLITYKSLPGSPQFQATFSDWELGARLIDSQFEPKVPAGATKVDFLSTEMRPPGGLAKKGGEGESDEILRGVSNRGERILRRAPAAVGAAWSIGARLRRRRLRRRRRPKLWRWRRLRRRRRPKLWRRRRLRRQQPL